ncbi:two-component system sensor histidine kinase [Flavobacterium psychrophilum]|nr:two-component system sensor histidine kinase [Flavobacterium psychrophilum]GAW88590.1 sensor histidine kinase [Flavobacterium psychrophilum]
MQYRTEKFIYQRVKKLYEEISFLDTNSILNQPVNSDLSQITTQVQQFATNKKLEIESLNDREEFRREFLGNVSHELKTPLFTVQGYISTLLDGAMKDKIIRKKYLERAEKGVERLIYIVEDLDTIAKLEIAEGRIEMTNFDIISLIQGVFDLLEMKANKKEIMLSFDSKYHKPIMVLGNYEKIQQVVTNLVENSIKYGKIGGSTEIGVEEVINNKILINVKDNGEGIEKQNISRLFERFYRVDKSGSRSEGGSGLGLAIVKHIIEAHNERIFVESKFRVGSEFSFTLQKTINQK